MNEKLLVPLALIIAVLFDRLIINMLDYDKFHMGVHAFWLCYLICFQIYFWKRVKNDKILGFIAVCSALLGIWYFLFGTKFRNIEYTMLSFFVIPGVLMAYAQMVAGYELKKPGRIMSAWFKGWFIKPFSGLPAMGRVVGSLTTGDNRKDVVRKSLIGILLALLLLCAIVPLLSSADKVFGYYTARLFADVNIGSIFWHTVAVIIAFMLFYSFLWNVAFGKKEENYRRADFAIDSIISGIVLGVVSSVYIIFCLVQFTYLFAGAGLPAGMTYSAYAREGFAQTVAVCSINLLLFGVFLQYGKGRVLNWLLAGLLGLTGIMLVSGMVRLHLYVDVYGLTWLRLLSAWFIVYLVAVVILAAFRLYFERLPIIIICALILLAWYVVLGYFNPDQLLVWYNLSFGYDLVPR